MFRIQTLQQSKKQHYHLWQWIEITLGVLITAAALSLFMVPNKIAGGGVSGFATVVHHVTGLPVGLLMILCNVPLFWLAFRRWGVQSVARSLYGSLLLSLFVDGISLLTNGRGFVGDPFLAALYGGVLAGIGMGFVFRGGGTTGGTDLLARLLQRNGGLSLGHTLLLVDGCVILLALFFFDIELALYALIAVFITGKMVDVIQEGLSYAKAVLIISDRTAEIGQALLSQMERGLTGFPSRGIYTNTQREALLCVVGQAEITPLKEMVKQIDANAFIIITQAQEVLGEGFRPLEEKEGEAK